MKTKDLGAEGNNGQIEFNGSQYELTRSDIQMILNALEIIEPDSDAGTIRARRLEQIFSQLAGSKRKKKNQKSAPRINVFMEGGLVHDIRKENTCVPVFVYDYDIESVDTDRLVKDEAGEECTIVEW